MRKLLLATLALLLLSAAPAAAVFFIEADYPVGVRMGSGNGGEISYSHFATNANILYGGATTGGTTSDWTFWLDGQVFRSGGSAPQPDPHYALDPGNGTQTWTINGMAYTLNSTLVTNGTLLVMTMANIDSVAHDAAFRYQWDTYLGCCTGTPDGPEIIIEGEPGDTPGSPGCYKALEANFAFPQFQMIKALQTCAGPDGPTDVKGYLTWDPALGGTTVDRFTVASWGRAYGASSAWHYEIEGNPQNVDNDNAVITWWGYYDPYHILPGEEVQVVFWYGVGVPPALAEYFVNAYYTDRPNAGPAENAEDLLADSTRVRFIDGGQTTYYPFTVANDGGLIGQASEDQEPTVFDVTVQGEAPPGWIYEVVRADSPQVVDSVSLRPQEQADLRIRVAAPEACSDVDADPNLCSMGNDAAQVNVTLSYNEKPSGFFNPSKSRLEHTLFTTTVVKPVYEVELYSEEEAKAVNPGESVEYTMHVVNKGNLRSPVAFDLNMLTLMNPGWTASFEPQRVLLTAGEEIETVLTVTVPTNEAGGDHILTARAGVSDKTDFDTEELGLTVIADRAISITTPETQRVVPPGSSVVFPFSVTNNGAQPVPVELLATMEEPAIDAGWTIELRNPGFPAVLNPGRTAAATLTLTAPADAQALDQASVLFAVLLAGEGKNVLADQPVTGVAGAVPSTQLTGFSGVPTVAPGSSVQFEVTATNMGNRDDDLRLLPSSLPANWKATIEPALMTLQPGDSGIFLVNLRIGEDAFAGMHDIEMRIVDRDSITQEFMARSINVAVVRDASIESEELVVRMLPDDTYEFNVLVSNDGNAADILSLTGFPEGFVVESAPAMPWSMDARSSQYVRIAVTSPDVIESYDVPLTAVSETGTQFPPGPAGQMKLHVSRPDLVVQKMEINGGREEAIHSNDLVTLQAKVINTGEVGARDFVVRLYVDGVATDNEYSVEFLDASSGSRTSVVLVPLTWVADATGDHELAIVADPEQKVKESRRDNNEQTATVNVQASSGSVQPLDSLDSFDNLRETPGPGAIFAVLLVGLVAALRRR